MAQLVTRQDAFIQGFLQLIWSNLKSVVLRRLEVDRVVTGYLVKNRFMQLLHHLPVILTKRCRAIPEILTDKKVSQVKAHHQISWILLILYRLQSVLNEHYWVFYL